MNSAVVSAEYELTKEDLAAFNLYHHFHSPTARRHYFRAWLIPPCVWLLVCTGIWYLADKARGTPLRTFLDLLPLFSGALIHFVIFPWWYRRKVRKLVAGMIGEGRNRGLLAHHRVTISPQFVTDSSENGQTSAAWRAVERVAAGRDYAYIYTNAFTAIIVPRRAFTGGSDLSSLFGRLETTMRRLASQLPTWMSFLYLWH